MQEPTDYNNEYRLHPSSSESLPEYVRQLVMKMHENRQDGALWACEAIIEQEPHRYSIMLDYTAITVANSLNGETDTVRHAVTDFELHGGIGDLLATMVEAGSLPETVAEQEIQVTEF